MTPARPRVAVVVCSCGRAPVLGRLLRMLARQTLPPSAVFLVVTQPGDVPPEYDRLGVAPVHVIYAPKGLARQRNAGLRAVDGNCDYLAFFDDDYLPTAGALAGLCRGFDAFPQAVGLNGRLLADGAGSGGITPKAAMDLIARAEATPGPDRPRQLRGPLVGLYGCNMVFRAQALNGLWFDETLPLYAWQEDVDFAARVPGIKLQTDAFSGVHCAVRSGRETGGAALGYSQVANVMHLVKKGSVPVTFGLRLMARNLLANHLRLLSPEPHIDRKARARGNRMALWDLVQGRLAPERILSLTGPGHP